nr:glycoprotein [Alfalfa dwarf virus]
MLGTCNIRDVAYKKIPTVMVYLTVLLLSSFLIDGRRGATVKSIDKNRLSIGPIAHCKGELLDLGVQQRNCYMKCEGYSEPKKGVTIGIANAKTKGPPVIRCSKVRLSQTFTQTWTWSTVSGDLSSEVVPTTVEECRESININCPTGNCDVRAPNKLEEEFHYASTTRVESLFIILQSVPSVLYIDDSKEWVSPMGTTGRFAAEEGVAQEEHNHYIWNKLSSLTTCPYQVEGTYGCDEFDEGDELFYVCAAGGLTVTPRKSSPLIHPSLCPGLKWSQEGLLYEISKGDPNSDMVGRLGIEAKPDTVESADNTYLRHKIQMVARKLDSDLCYTQCEIMALESRSANKSAHLVRAGHEHYLAYSNGTAQYCGPITGCRLSDPPLMCGNPPRVGIVCVGTSRLWDPLLPYITDEHRCDKPREIEEMHFNLGASKYIVDRQLTIPVNKTDLHGVYHSEFFRYHNSRMMMAIDDLSKLKPDWDKAKQGKPIDSVKTESSRSVDAPHIMLGGWFLRAWQSVRDMFHSVEAVIGCIVIVLAVYMTVMLILKIKSASTDVLYRPVQMRMINKSKVTNEPERVVWT